MDIILSRSIFMSILGMIQEQHLISCFEYNFMHIVRLLSNESITNNTRHRRCSLIVVHLDLSQFSQLSRVTRGRDIASPAGPVDVYIDIPPSVGGPAIRRRGLHTDVLASLERGVLFAGKHTESVCTEVITLWDEQKH
jgi:hypothetical protein